MIVLVAALLSVASTLYPSYIYDYVALVNTEDYAYLVVLVPVVFWLLIVLILKHAEPSSPNAYSAVSAALSLVLSLSLYALARLSPPYALQLGILSLAAFGWAMMSLLFRFKTFLASVSSLLLLAALTPLPSEFVYSMSVPLTVFSTKLTAFVTGAELIETRAYLLLRISDASGVVRTFYVAPTCAGIVSILSILSLTPFLVYHAMSSVSVRKRRLITLAKAVTVGLAIVLAGNLLRLMSVVLITRYVSYSLALDLFHSLPSILYASIAAAAAVMIILKLPRPRGLINIVRRGVSVLSVILVLTASIAYPFTAEYVANSITAETTPTVSLERLLQSPASIVLNLTNASVLYDVPHPIVGEMIGALSVRSIVVSYAGKRFSGYLEIAETPSRFHGWQVCLTAQGYSIIESWVETRNATVNIIVAARGTKTLVLGYAVYKLETTAEGRTSQTYVRVSLMAMTARSNALSIAAKITDFLNELATTIGSPTEPRLYVSTLATLLNISLTASAAFIAVNALARAGMGKLRRVLHFTSKNKSG